MEFVTADYEEEVTVWSDLDRAAVCKLAGFDGHFLKAKNKVIDFDFDEEDGEGEGESYLAIPSSGEILRPISDLIVESTHEWAILNDDTDSQNIPFGELDWGDSFVVETPGSHRKETFIKAGSDLYGPECGVNFVRGFTYEFDADEPVKYVPNTRLALDWC